MNTKDPPVCLTNTQMEYLLSLNELSRRHYLASLTSGPTSISVMDLCKFLKVSKNTIYRGIFELENKITPGCGRIRKPGGGAKPKMDKHPEWLAAFLEILDEHLAGLPQDESTQWLDINVAEVRRLMHEKGHDVSYYIARQMISMAGLKRRTFTKSLPMSVVEDRNPQFEKIAMTKHACLEAGIPIISIDTKKKEMIGNFKRSGHVYCSSSPKALDHDFATFSSGAIIPHGIYDIANNTGYLTLGTSHDTSEFVCDNIERVWNDHLKTLYPNADLLVVLCDGGGSNSCRHHIVKQDLIDLSCRIGKRILVMHYPPYCSKFNPIEHRLFSQITRSWSGAPLLSVENACERADRTVTSTGLKVSAKIVDKVYEIKRNVCDSFAELVKKHVIFDKSLHNWNYLISPLDLSQLIF